MSEPCTAAANEMASSLDICLFLICFYRHIALLEICFHCFHCAEIWIYLRERSLNLHLKVLDTGFSISPL